MKIRNVVLTVLMLWLLIPDINSQTPFTIFNSGNGRGAEQVNANQLSAGSLWFGSRLSYNFAEDKPVNDNFILTGKIIYAPIVAEKYAIPIVVTASNGKDPSQSGYNMGVFPYYKLVQNSAFTLLAHGGVSYRSFSGESGADLQQIKALVGLEAAVFGVGGGLPFTVSISPIYTNTSGTIGSSTLLEITGVVPISKGLGALIEWQSGVLGGIKGGIIVNVNTK
jgi:hypothetical protein